MILNENSKLYLIRVLREEYSQRLDEVLGEVDVTDKSGNVLVQPGLKVRHKSSGYEYTVAGINGSHDGDGLQVKLRLPDEPRFDPPPEGEEVLGGPEELREDDLVSQPSEIPPVMPSAPIDVHIEPEEDQGSPDEEVVFYVDEKDFEKNYEVD